MDDMITRQVPWDKLDRLVPDDARRILAEQSLEFLKIAPRRLAAILAERNAIESAERRDMLIEAEAKRLAGSTAPVIAAGSTGSMPATAKLLATIAKLPHGAVVLPGLDTDLDDASWALIAGDADDKTHDGAPAAGHAQFAMHALLDRIGIARGDVAATRAAGRARPRAAGLGSAAAGRHHRELAGAHRHQRFRRRRRQRARLARLDRSRQCRGRGAGHRGRACARRCETPDKTAALVTPDRALARRVVAALERWQVDGRRFRRRQPRRHVGRRVRQACGAKPRSAASRR